MVSVSLEICLNRVLDFRASFDLGRDCSGTWVDMLVWPYFRQKCDLWASGCPQDVFHFARVRRNGQICCRAATAGLLLIATLPQDESYCQSKQFGSLLISIYQYNLYI